MPNASSPSARRSTAVDCFIVRHADAGDRDAKRYPDDRLRPLSVDGKADMLRVARGMRRLGFEIDRIIDSGLVRARQTSECICDAYEMDRGEILTMEALAPETEPSETLAALRKVRGLRHVALVGHEPHLGHLVATLVSGGSDLHLDFKKAGVCRIEVSRWSAGGGILSAMLPPKPLRRIGK